ncbi:transposase [Symmachiella dynata]|uniref:transposase n=1 Tax=Symmachiella dynata TaxID=2527995 RepID=UPI0030B8B0D8
MIILQRRGVDAVCHLSSHRNADFQRGSRLGKRDHLIVWPKPRQPPSIDRKSDNSLPDYLMMRETQFQVEQPGFRTQKFIVTTTFLDAHEYPQDDLAQLYRARWNAELDLRNLKQTMHMEILRCKTPELVRKEIWTHILEYNLIRTMIALAATQNGLAL